MSQYITDYLNETCNIAKQVDYIQINRLIKHLKDLKKNKGRLFILGNGGSAANASHAVNDFRKICGIDAHTPTDNVAELTARINDEGWEYAFKNYLSTFYLTPQDALLILSVGGGKPGTSMNIVRAITHIGIPVLGIVGKDGGETAAVATACILLPTSSTPHVESFQSVLLHLIVNHPDLCA